MNIPTPPISSTLLTWLQATDSLTLRAKKLCQEVKVQLLRQVYTEFDNRENYQPYLLESQGLLREIYMLCDTVPWWYAKTLIPSATYQLRKTQFDNLDTTPLAELLYNDPQVTRRELIYYPVDAQRVEYQWATQHLTETSPTLWARRSWFMIASSPLLMWEVLLPKLGTLN